VIGLLQNLVIGNARGKFGDVDNVVAFLPEPLNHRSVHALVGQ
jgi:hypothetical protein